MGFTLIELLVTVLIVCILAAIAVPQYQKAVWKSRYASLKIAAQTVAKAQEIYFLANGKYLNYYSHDTLDIAYNSPEITCPITTDGQRIECWFKTKGQTWLTYEIRFQHVSSNPGRTSCYAHNSDLKHITNQVCKAETGRSAPSRGTGTPWFAWDYQ